MGVRRLTALLETHRDIYHDGLFGNNRLVIDGCDLIKQLYFDSGLDQNHGGEYAAFAELIENFITALSTSSVSPYVVLQVSKDAIGKNRALTYKVQNRICQAHRAAVEGSQENILPLLASLVFKQTLVRLKVPMVMCYEEADQEIAALANEWDCPVLSSNSDFYILDVPAGMLPLSHFQWRALEQRDSQSFIPCKNYSTSNFCTVFGIQKQLLPMFGALAKQKWPIRWNKFSPDSEEKWSRLQGLLCWLKGFQLYEEAVEATLELIPGLLKEKRQKVRDALYKGMQEYWLPHSHLKNFFTDGTLPSFPEAADVIPDWIHPLLVQGKMTTDILEVLRLKRRVLGICVGSVDLPSAYLTSRPLRRVMYGLLLPEWHSDLPVEVVETDRVGLKLEDIRVSPVFQITSENLQLDSLHKVEHCHRLLVLLKALGVSEAALSRLRPELRLPVAVTCYWWQNARPTLGERLLKALLLGLSVGALQSQEEDIKSHEFDSSASKGSNVALIYSVTQWQICLKDSVQLNQLLGLPLPEPQISRLYEGALVHRLVQLMTPGKGKNLLKQNVSIVEEYENMLAIVRQFDCQQPRRGREAQGEHLQEVTDWEQLFEPEEEAAANRSLSGLDLEQTVSLRMRFTRNRRQWIWNKNMSDSNPMVILKHDRKGGHVDI